jgi:hypothetical protein
MTDKPHKITILWGQDHEDGDEPKTYEFATEGELDAFRLGIDEMDGWLGYEFVEEGFVWPGPAMDEDDG